MKVVRRLLIAAGCLLLTASAADAAILYFDFQGKAGPGLLTGNENHVVNGGGSGGELGSGIFYDDATNLLTLNFGWGSANGFADLSGNASAGHIHGPTAAGGAASFTQNAGVAYGLNALAGWTASQTSGGFSGAVTLTEAHEANLLAGQFYVNVHTSANGAGEIRGNLVRGVPEPGAAALLVLGALGGVAARRRAAR